LARRVAAKTPLAAHLVHVEDLRLLRLVPRQEFRVSLLALDRPDGKTRAIKGEFLNGSPGWMQIIYFFLEKSGFLCSAGATILSFDSVNESGKNGTYDPKFRLTAISIRSK